MVTTVFSRGRGGQPKFCSGTNWITGAPLSNGMLIALSHCQYFFPLQREFPDALCQCKPQQQKYNLSVLCTCARGRREKDIFKTAEAEQWLYTVHRLCSTDATIMSLLSKKPE